MLPNADVKRYILIALALVQTRGSGTGSRDIVGTGEIVFMFIITGSGGCDRLKSQWTWLYCKTWRFLFNLINRFYSSALISTQIITSAMLQYCKTARAERRYVKRTAQRPLNYPETLHYTIEDKSEV